VRGNIFAPRVGIMEGATFNGRVEMDPNAAAAQAGQGGARTAARQSGTAARTAPPAAATAARAGNATGSSRGAPPAVPAPQAPAVAAPPLSGSAVDHLLSTPGQAKR
jgi:hypothetical protein